MPLALSLIVLVAMLVEAWLGFGAMVVTVAAGALVMPLDQLLPIVVPLNLLLSSVILLRGARHVNLRLLLRRVLPAMGLGLPLGMALARVVDGAAAKTWFALLVILLAALELWRSLGRSATTATAPLRPAWSIVLLVAAGVVHGLFATGGPLAVYVLGREVTDKRVFRATLAALWLVLNSVLVAGWWVAGRYAMPVLHLAALLLPALVVGLAFGELAHGRLPERGFRIAVYGLLLVSGLFLLVS